MCWARSPADVQTFVCAMDTLFGGFGQRAHQTFRLLQADGTAFLVIAAPSRSAREAAYFVDDSARTRCRLEAWS